MYKCPICHGDDTEFRSYGENPEFVLVACFDCARFSLATIRKVRVEVDL